jgi:hypothetical protein
MVTTTFALKKQTSQGDIRAHSPFFLLHSQQHQNTKDLKWLQTPVLIRYTIASDNTLLVRCSKCIRTKELAKL